MIDSISFRVRIGMFASKYSAWSKNSAHSRNPHYGHQTLTRLLVYTVPIIMYLVAMSGLYICLNWELFGSGNHSLVTNTVTAHGDVTAHCEMAHQNVTAHGNETAQILHYISSNSVTISYVCMNWNLYMRSINGNTKNTLNIAHWNGGSSFLCKSDRGKEKLQQIEYNLTTYNMHL